MKRKLFFIIAIFCFSLTSFAKWIKTTAVITHKEIVEKDYYGYTLTYKIRKKDAYENIDGKLITGPIQVNVFTKKKLKQGEKIKLYYDSEEPIFFKTSPKL